jgi:nicotinamidase-related amidase
VATQHLRRRKRAAKGEEEDMKGTKWALAFALLAALGFGASTLQASIIDEWANVKVPPPPQLKPVTVDPKTTALLVLDLFKQPCNVERNPRCVQSLTAIKKLLDEARGAGMLVVFTAYPTAAGKPTAKDILPEVAPHEGEAFFVGFLNKYIGTDLEKTLKDKGIQTVIAVGTFAHGAVLATAGASAELGFKVIVPVDGMSSPTLYAEQYTAWHLTNAPIVSSKTTLTTIDMMKF